jgi:hypothetical protein
MKSLKLTIILQVLACLVFLGFNAHPACAQGSAIHPPQPGMLRTFTMDSGCNSFLTRNFANSRYKGSFERKFQTAGPAQLEIDAGSDDQIIRSGPAGSVSISGRIRVDNTWVLGNRTTQVHQLEGNPPVHQDGNTIHIGPTGMKNISVDYEIIVPSDTRVRSRTGSGDLKIQGLNADLDLQTGSGDLCLENIKGSIQAHTGSGDVLAKSVSGNFRADASSGDIQLEKGGDGSVSVRTTSGDIAVRGITGMLRLEAGSGDINAEGAPAGNWEARAGSGNVHLSLPRDSAFQLDASTSSGELNVNHAITVTVQGNLDAARHELKGTVGSGGPRVTVHTGSGDIDIE